MNGAQLVATTAEPAFAVDDNGRILAWNRGAEKLLGYRQKEVLGRPCWEVTDGRDVFANRYCGKTCPVREMARRSDPIHRSQMLFRTACGTETQVGVSILVAHDADGRAQVVHLLEEASAGERVALPTEAARACGPARGTF